MFVPRRVIDPRGDDIGQHLFPFLMRPWINSPLRLEPSTSNCSPI